ncbi:carboxylating nicotinate-nucleotide diphosphorylase [soil metagenome]
MTGNPTAWQLDNISNTLIDLALREDLGQPWLDITTATLFAGEKVAGEARIISKHPESIIICGLSLLKTLFAKLDHTCQFHSTYQDGQLLLPSSTLVTINADRQALLMAERITLNFLRHLSAIASLTAKFVAKVAHTKLQILDTRKTTPGLRQLEKYAIQCGGGVNHRMGLYDAIMIKDTHVDMIGGMAKALAKLPLQEKMTVIVEVRDLEELQVALQLGRNKLTRILLDNMSLADMRIAVDRCRGIFPTEASGNINLDTITAIAETGVDYASVGMLTYAAGQVDLSMQVGRV